MSQKAGEKFSGDSRVKRKMNFGFGMLFEKPGGQPIIQSAQRLLRAEQKFFAVTGKRRLSAVFFKQGKDELLLQLGNGMAEAGLGNSELFCRLCVMPYVGQFDKISKIKQIQ